MPRRRRRCRSGFGPATLMLSFTVAALASGCSLPAAPESREPATDQTADAAGPAYRTAAVITTGCGSASATIGSAVRLDDHTVLTAAHVVGGAERVAVLDSADLPAERSWPDFSPPRLFALAAGASIVAFDAERDLALVSTDEATGVLDGGPQPQLGTVAAETPIEVHGVATPDRRTGVVAERTIIVADAVRGRDRVRRDGYLLDVATTGGDSGAGIWAPDGRLVGLVFAVSSADETRTWAVSGGEIERFLDEVDAGPHMSFHCDEVNSRLMVEP